MLEKTNLVQTADFNKLEFGQYGSKHMDTAGTAQVETATIVGTITSDGDIVVTVTSSLFTNPVILNVTVADTDTASAVATLVRTALGADSDITNWYAVSGTGADVVLTALYHAANDATLNIAYTNGTSSGLTEDASSVNTTAGAAGDSLNQSDEIIIKKITALAASVVSVKQNKGDVNLLSINIPVGTSIVGHFTNVTFISGEILAYIG